jgi:hypothetical protein
MDIQLLFVLVIFLVAIFFIARSFYLRLTGKKKAGCEECGIVGKNPDTKIQSERK